VRPIGLWHFLRRAGLSNAPAAARRYADASRALAFKRARDVPEKPELSPDAGPLKSLARASPCHSSDPRRGSDEWCRLRDSNTRPRHYEWQNVLFLQYLTVPRILPSHFCQRLAVLAKWTDPDCLRLRGRLGTLETATRKEPNLDTDISWCLIVPPASSRCLQRFGLEGARNGSCSDLSLGPPKNCPADHHAGNATR